MLERPRVLVELLMYSPWHQEGVSGTRPKTVKFQTRPNPVVK